MRPAEREKKPKMIAEDMVERGEKEEGRERQRSAQEYKATKHGQSSETEE